MQGNILDHEYKIEGPAGTIAEVCKKWFRVRDTYGVNVEPGPGRRDRHRRVDRGGLDVTSGALSSSTQD